MPVPGTPGNRKSFSYLTLRYLKLSTRLWKVNIFSWHLEEWFRKKIWIDRYIIFMDYFSDKTQASKLKEYGEKWRRVRYHCNGHGRVRYHLEILNRGREHISWEMKYIILIEISYNTLSTDSTTIAWRQTHTLTSIVFPKMIRKKMNVVVNYINDRYGRVRYHISKYKNVWI